jgi:hypothetical protein
MYFEHKHLFEVYTPFLKNTIRSLCSHFPSFVQLYTASSKNISEILKLNIFLNIEQNSGVIFLKCVETLKICHTLTGFDVSTVCNSTNIQTVLGFLPDMVKHIRCVCRCSCSDSVSLGGRNHEFFIIDNVFHIPPHEKFKWRC